jgi:hypothetical protein
VNLTKEILVSKSTEFDIRTIMRWSGQCASPGNETHFESQCILSRCDSINPAPR